MLGRQPDFNEQLGLKPATVLNARKGAWLLTTGAACLFVPQRLECGLVQVRLLVLRTGSTLPLLIHSLHPWQPLLLIPEDHAPTLDTSWRPCSVWPETVYGLCNCLHDSGRTLCYTVG